MKNFFFVFLLIMLLFSCKSNEVLFWEWFSNNQTSLFNYEENKITKIHDIQEHLGKVNSFLTFDFGPKQNETKRDFTISANERRSIFKYVEALYTAAPVLDKFNIIKYKPRIYPLEDFIYDNIDHDYNNIKIQIKDIKFILEKGNSDRIGIILFVNDYGKLVERDCKEIGLEILLQALGEYDFVMKVDKIQFGSIKSDNSQRSIPISELTKYFDDYFRKQS